MKNIHTHQIDSLSEYIKLLERKLVDKYRITLFRGQNTDKSLIPSIARYYFKTSREVDEKRMLEEFSTQSFQYLEYIPTTDLEKLTIAQHYGIPTRLLDWTENALTALYFAVTREPFVDDSAVVWVISFERDSELLYTNQEGKIFEETNIKFFKPATIISRVTSQFGWFSIHPYYGQGYYERADKEYHGSIRLNKIIIGEGKSKKILDSLESCGINNHSIFRDLDSLGEYIFKKYRQNRKE